MKDKDYKVVNIYTQANGEKIAVSMLKCTKKSFWVDIAPTTEVEKYGKIEGEIVSHWGKLPVVLVTVPEFKALKKEYEVEEYRAPYYRQSEREKKPRPDAAALKLYKVFATDEANPQRDADGLPVKITVDGYSFHSGGGAEMLKALKRNFNFTKADIAAALALNIDEPQQQPEPAAADEDIEAAVVDHFEDLAANAPADGPSADIVRAGIETGKVIICSVPKAEPAPQLPKPPAVVYIDTPTNQKTDNPPAKKTAADEFIESGAYPIWYNSELVCSSHTGVEFKVVSWGRKQVKVEYDNGQRRIFPVRVFIDSVERGDIIVAAPYDAEYMAKLNQPAPASEKTAPTDAEVLEQAERIRASYEALKAEAEREQAAAAFAEAITAYCEELSRPEPLAWEPETIIVPFMPRPDAEVEQQPRRRHRLNLRPRLSRWLHPARWVAVVFVVCLLSGLLLGMNTSTAADAAADDIAAAYDLAPVTVTAEAPDTFIEDKAPCLIEDKAPCLIEGEAPCLIEDKAPRLIEDKAPAPSPVKKLEAPSPVKNVAEAAECSSQKTDAADSPAGEKTASPMATATDAAGLTICEGTPWAYTMMNWA